MRRALGKLAASSFIATLLIPALGFGSIGGQEERGDEATWWSPVSALQATDQQSRWLWAGALISTTALGFALDRSASEWLAGQRRIGDLAAWTDGLIGTGVPGLGLAAVLLLNGLSPTTPETTRDQNARTGQALLASIVWTSVTVSGLKLATQRERPDGSDRASFPSGHTSTVMALVGPVWSRWGWQAGLATATLGALTGIGRIQSERHHFSDTVAGAVIGLFWGFAFADLRFVSLARLDLISASSLGGTGVRATWTF